MGHQLTSLNPVFPPKTPWIIGYASFANAASKKVSISCAAFTTLPSLSRAGIATPPTFSKPLRNSESSGRRPSRGPWVEKYLPSEAGAVPAMEKR